MEMALLRYFDPAINSNSLRKESDPVRTILEESEIII